MSRSPSSRIAAAGFAAALATASLWLCTAARGQQAAASGTLVSVKASGSSRFSSEKIAQSAGLKIGQPAVNSDLQAAANHLAQLGVFKDVRFRFNSQQGKLEVEFQVVDAPSLAPLFDNFPWFTDDEIEQALKSAVPLYDGRVPENGAILEDISQALGKLLETRKVTGTVTHQVIRLATTNDNVQQFRLEGPDLTIESVEFTDPVAKDDHAIQQSLGDIRGKPFSRAVIDRFTFEQVRPIYLAHGDLNVRFDPPQARFTGDPSKPLPSSVKAIIGIHPGPTFKWAGAAWTGNAAFSSADLDALLAMKAGEAADGMKLEAGYQNILDAYGKKGYLDAALDKTPSLDAAAARASYRIAISEGPQYHMGALVLSGLSLEGERRILAAWKIPNGAVFDASYLDSFIEGGARAAFGDLPWGYEKIGHYLQKDPQHATVDVLMDFQ